MSFLGTVLRMVLAGAVTGAGAQAGTVSGGSIIEDFSTLDHADLSVSTGLWNTVDRFARARVYANGAAVSTKPVDFGDGSDGVLDTSSGYTFDTDSHPSGYNFKSVRITGGTITVQGSRPLIIRSLSTLLITPALRANGANGTVGSVSGAATSGGAAVTCLANGGVGGGASLGAGLDGGHAIQSDGSVEAGTRGAGVTGALSGATVDGQAQSTGPASNDFETATNFICGTGGAGGGGYHSTVLGTFASGSSGGAGGGIIKLVSVGDMSVGGVESKGGSGGDGVVLGGGQCSGNGSGGFGGVVHMQTLGGLTTASDPDVSGGNSGTTCAGGSGAGFSGYTRGDTASTAARPAWATVAGSFDMEVVPASLTSVVQSKVYDMGVLNAGFSAATASTVGTVAMQYAGSADGVIFGDFTSDITALSNQGYRYLKFKATFTNPAVAGVAPKLTRLAIPFTELGLESFDMKLSAGCGTVTRGGGGEPRATAFWMLLLLFYGLVRTLRRGVT